eukprot:681100-Ditylum_brightwellii.AAC.1
MDTYPRVEEEDGCQLVSCGNGDKPEEEQAEDIKFGNNNKVDNIINPPMTTPAKHLLGVRF